MFLLNTWHISKDGHVAAHNNKKTKDGEDGDVKIKAS